MVATDRKLAVEFGARVKEARERRGLTQDELAEALKTDKGSVSRIEAGKRTRIGFGLIRDLSSALKVHVSDLLEPRRRATR